MIFSARQKRLIGRLLFLLIPYSLLRIGFYLYHLNVYKQFTESEIFTSFLWGVRFDLAAICYLNSPLILLAIIPHISEKFERVLFIAINSVAIITSIIDYELFLFTGKRLSLDFFVIGDDILAQLPQLFVYYWYLNLAAVVFVVFFYLLDWKIFKERPDQRRLLAGVLLAGLAFVGIRGGLQYKSINVQSAFVQGKNELGHLVLNTPYHFLRTLKNKTTQKLSFFQHDDEAKAVLLNHRSFKSEVQGIKKANVVLIILESFALEYMEKGYTPFLSELAKDSLFFERHLANGRRSIECLPSLLCGLPSLLDEPISKSSFQGNKFVCMPKILKDAGYTNYFFHAGARGTMGFEAYTLSTGFDRYFSKEDYPGKDDYDGTWGIFDGPFLKFMADEVGKMPEPFLAGVFTLSSHQPYSIPEKLKGKFNKGTLEIHESIGYTDHSLREFFDSIKDKEWFKRTLFIITADHTQKLESKKYLANTIGDYRVPLLIYAPGVNWKISKPQKVTQHSDIPDTVLDFVGVAGELPLLGRSVFSLDRGMAVNFAGGNSYFLIQDEDVILLDAQNAQKKGHYDWETGELSLAGESEELLLKAYLQYFINGLINNNLSVYR